MDTVAEAEIQKNWMLWEQHIQQLKQAVKENHFEEAEAKAFQLIEDDIEIAKAVEEAEASHKENIEAR